MRLAAIYGKALSITDYVIDAQSCTVGIDFRETSLPAYDTGP